MKYNVLIFAAAMAVAASSRAAESTNDVANIALGERITELRKFIMPPEGTKKTDVDSVYGAPVEVKEPQGKGPSADYPMDTYELLPPDGKEDFHAFLYVTYRGGKVWRAGINHIGVLKNRQLNRAGSSEYLKQKQEIQGENRSMLIDLQNIRDKFAEKLGNASWNKQSSEQTNAPASSSAADPKR